MEQNTTVQAFRYKPTQLVSFEFFQLCQYLRQIIGVLQVPTYAILVYVVLKKSPFSMGAYKW
jgi:hypothetical protein